MNAYQRLQNNLADSEENTWGIVDILTLLLVFFIILYVNEKGDFKPEVEAYPQSQQQVLALSYESERDTRDEFIPIPDLRRSEAGQGVLGGSGYPIGEGMGMLSHRFSDLHRDGLRLSAQPNSFLVTIEERLGFKSGRADLRRESLAVLDRLAVLLLERQDYRVVVSGHSDDLPINNSHFSSNWYLSSARAVAVTEYLVSRGIKPDRVVSQGYAEHRPVVANDSPENRARNRRVEIRLVEPKRN